MGIMAKTDLTNKRQVFVEEYVRSGDHLEATKKAGYKHKSSNYSNDS
jgi:phage terminase small subunit